MTLKELHEVEEKGKKVFEVLDMLAHEFEKQAVVSIDIKRDLNLFASAKPCFIIKKKGWFGTKLFYFRNTITNPRQPSPFFIRIFDKQYEKKILNLLQKYQPQIEEALRIRVVMNMEEKI